MTHRVVLQGRARQEERAAVAEVFAEGAAEAGAVVLEAVRLVDDQHLGLVWFGLD